MNTLQAQWDSGLEAMPKVVPAVCRVYVRVPAGWMTTRSLALDILKQMSPSAAPAIKAAAIEERQWITEISDTDFLMFDRSQGRDLYVKAVDYLGYIADCLESGSPNTKKSPIAIEEEKLYLDKPPFSEVPEDAYFAMGHDGQFIAIIPSRELVVVRLGLSRSVETRDHGDFLAGILAAMGG